MTREPILDQETDSMLIAVPQGDAIDLSLEKWGSRIDIEVMSRRIMVMMPGGSDLTNNECRLVAQYAITSGLNPWGGDFHVWPTRKRQDDPQRALVIKPDYKLIVRWARSRCQFSVRYEAMDQADLPEGAIGSLCYLIRYDALPNAELLLRVLGPEAARQHLEVQGRGILLKKEIDGRDAPKGKDYAFIAQKRALEHAIRQAYGKPTTADLAALSWMVGDVQTTPSDWAVVPDRDLLDGAGAEVAALNAQVRLRTETPSQITAPQALDDLFGDGAGAEYLDSQAKQAQAQAQEKPDQTPAYDQPRPWTAQQVQAAVDRWIFEYSGPKDEATNKQISLLCSKLEQCFGGDGQERDKRIKVLGHLCHVTSAKQLTRPQAHALLKWVLGGGQDDTGDYPLAEHAPSEAHAVLDAWLEAQGQIRLDFSVPLPQAEPAPVTG